MVGDWIGTKETGRGGRAMTARERELYWDH